MNVHRLKGDGVSGQVLQSHGMPWKFSSLQQGKLGSTESYLP